MSKGHRKVQLERREFLATSAVGSAFLLTQAQDTRAATKGPSGSLMEYGFWDYATPGAGGMEAFKQDDYVSLLDDMAQAGMNSLMIFVKWLTTGYRSRLPFQDQSPDNPVIASELDRDHLRIRQMGPPVRHDGRLHRPPQAGRGQGVLSPPRSHDLGRRVAPADFSRTKLANGSGRHSQIQAARSVVVRQWRPQRRRACKRVEAQTVRLRKWGGCTAGPSGVDVRTESPAGVITSAWTPV